MINGSVILGGFFLFQKLFYSIPGNTKDSGCCSFWFCLLVHSVHSCPVFQIFHLFFVSFPYALGIRKRFYISQRGGSIFLVNPGPVLIINQQVPKSCVFWNHGSKIKDSHFFSGVLKTVPSVPVRLPYVRQVIIWYFTWSV